jgi:methyl-branched lipid omega-hydroxylase
MSMGFDEIDLMNSDLFADGPPHELFKRMRDEAPVRWNNCRPDTGADHVPGFWSVTRDEDVAAISRDPASFSSHEGGIFLNPDQVVPLELTRNLLLYKDPPEHTKYRQILQKSFVPHTVRTFENRVRARITRVIDAVTPAGRCDFVNDIAVPVPLGVLAELLGLPDEDIPKLKRWTDEIEAAQLARESSVALPTFGEMAQYLMEQIQIQAQAGGDTLVTKLREAEVDGNKLSDAEILVFFGLLVFAGNDTTRNTASSGMLALLEHPEQWRMLREDHTLITNAVEEILRYTSVVNYFARTAKTDTAIGGQCIARGEKVVMWYTSASRDERVTPDPQDFDVTRTEINHRAFGGGGRHFCLGAGLARLELRILFEQLVQRMPDIRLAGPVQRLHSSWANSLSSMPVEFTPGVKAGSGRREETTG